MHREGLTACGLVKRYGEVVALDGFELVARPGEIVGLVGANGSGKTTFVEVVSGLVRPDRGSVSIFGVDMLRNPRAGRRLFGLAPQEVALYFSATVRENLTLFGGLLGLRNGQLRRAIDEAAEQMRLAEVMDRPAGVLSGGQRRRAQVASALLGSPSLLLLDEPTAGADPPTRDALLTSVLAMAAAGTAIVYTTHYLPELTELDATLAVVKSGRVIARGDQDTLLAGLPGEVRVQLDGPMPDRLHDLGTVVGGELRVSCADPARMLAALLADGIVPVSVDVRRASLDDLYNSLGTVVPA